MGAADQVEIDLALVHVHPCDLHHHLVTELVDAPAALADQAMMHRIELVVITLQRGHMHQAVDHQVLELHEHAETGDRGDQTGKLLADVFLQVFAFQPVGRVAGRIIGAPLEA